MPWLTGITLTGCQRMSLPPQARDRLFHFKVFTVLIWFHNVSKFFHVHNIVQSIMTFISGSFRTSRHTTPSWCAFLHPASTPTPVSSSIKPSVVIPWRLRPPKGSQIQPRLLLQVEQKQPHDSCPFSNDACQQEANGKNSSRQSLEQCHKPYGLEVEAGG